MPTRAPNQDHPAGSEPHRHRQVAESFGTDPERYDRTRPRYPDALVDRIVTASPRADGAGPEVLDVGCGTGIAARQFQAAGCTVLGVEPDTRMAQFARRTGLRVEVATFEEWEPAGRTFDAVIAGQAWHWIDPAAGVVKAARALRPGGRLALFWYVFQLPPEVADAFVAAYRRVLPDPPVDFTAMPRQALDGYQVLFTRAADGIRAAGGFSDPEQWRFDWERPYPRDEWLDLMPTQGTLTRLPPDRLAQILDEVGAAIDAMGGAFTMPYTAVAVTCTRQAAGRPTGGD